MGSRDSRDFVGSGQAQHGLGTPVNSSHVILQPAFLRRNVLGPFTATLYRNEGTSALKKHHYNHHESVLPRECETCRCRLHEHAPIVEAHINFYDVSVVGATVIVF